MKTTRIALAILLLSSGLALAQDSGQQHMDHSAMMGAMAPRETGQAAFAAIQEIVELLVSDPTADWSKVDIEALRQHLIDMNNVTLSASVTTEEEGDRLRFSVSGQGPVRDSVRRMVAAHVMTMNGVDGWRLTSEPTPDGAVLTVTPPDGESLVKLRGLGFIGVMALGMHHQQHHLMIAKGSGPHQ